MSYVVKDLVIVITYRHTLEHIQLVNLINVVYVVNDLVSINYYRNTLEHIQVVKYLCQGIHYKNTLEDIYKCEKPYKDLVRIIDLHKNAYIYVVKDLV